MRHDAAYGYSLDQPAQGVKFLCPLLPVQSPVHVGVLHQFKQAIARGEFFNARGGPVVAARRKLIQNANRQFRLRESCAFSVEFQVALLPRRRQLRQRVLAAE